MAAQISWWVCSKETGRFQVLPSLCLANSWCVRTHFHSGVTWAYPLNEQRRAMGFLLCEKPQEKTKLVLLSSQEEHQGSDVRVKWPSPAFADVPSSPSQAFSGILCVCAGRWLTPVRKRWNWWYDDPPKGFSHTTKIYWKDEWHLSDCKVIHRPFPHIHWNGEPSFLVAAFCWFLYLLALCFSIFMLNRTSGACWKLPVRALLSQGAWGRLPAPSRCVGLQVHQKENFSGKYVFRDKTNKQKYKTKTKYSRTV